MLAPSRTTADSMASAMRNWTPEGMRVVLFSENSVVQRSKPFLAAFGGVALTYLSIKALYCTGKAVISYFLAGPLKLGADLKKSGDWAVITGASDGIGKEFVYQLAQKGLNIVLVARNLDKLEGVARDITAKYNVQTKIIAIDLGKMGPHNVPQMQEEMKDLRIALLVNSAGVLGGIGRFLATPQSDEEAANIVNLNARAVVMMIRAVMPLMLANKQKTEQRYIINVGAILGGVRPSAGTAIYGASKAFIDSISQALHREYHSQGISVQSFIPGATQTKMLAPQFHKSIITVSAPDAVRGSLSQLGLRSRTFGTWRHAAAATFMGMMSVVELY